jgi:hypothetical protein
VAVAVEQVGIDGLLTDIDKLQCENKAALMEKLQLLALAMCVGDDITPSIRSTVKRANIAPIENANLCM